MPDIYSNAPPNFLVGPCSRAFSVTPNDVTDLPNTTRALYVGGDGDVSILTPYGETVLFKSVPVGTVLPVRAQRVRSTGTTATFIVGLY